jgi:hypothetical protein
MRRLNRLTDTDITLTVVGGISGGLFGLANSMYDHNKYETFTETYMRSIGYTIMYGCLGAGFVGMWFIKIPSAACSFIGNVYYHQIKK